MTLCAVVLILKGCEALRAEQQQKQAFHVVSIFYGIKNTDQGKIDVLKNKKANISTKKLVEFFAEKFMDCL